MGKATFENQLKRTFQAFREEPKTMLQVEVETGIMRPNICRFVAYLRKRNKIATHTKGTCPISNHRAQFLTTDPALIPQPGQAELFKIRNQWPD